MQLHFKTSTAAQVVRPPVNPEIRFAHQRGMFGTCHHINAYCGHEQIGGATCDPSRGLWVISVGSVDLTYQHDLSISVDENLASVDQIIADEFAKASVLREGRAL